MAVEGNGPVGVDSGAGDAGPDRYGNSVGAAAVAVAVVVAVAAGTG